MTKFWSLKTDGKGPTLTKQIAKICPKTQKAKALQSKWQKYDLKTDDQGPTFKKRMAKVRPIYGKSSNHKQMEKFRHKNIWLRVYGTFKKNLYPRFR